MLTVTPRTKLKVEAKFENNHPEIQTGDYLKKRFLTEDCKSHIETDRKGRVSKGVEG